MAHRSLKPWICFGECIRPCTDGIVDGFAAESWFGKESWQ
jgi:hypothetical protein